MTTAGGGLRAEGSGATFNESVFDPADEGNFAVAGSISSLSIFFEVVGSPEAFSVNASFESSGFTNFDSAQIMLGEAQPVFSFFPTPDQQTFATTGVLPPGNYHFEVFLNGVAQNERQELAVEFQFRVGDAGDGPGPGPNPIPLPPAALTGGLALLAAAAAGAWAKSRHRTLFH